MDDEEISRMLHSLKGELRLPSTGGGRQLLDWADNSADANITFVVVAVILVLFAGCMSGLTLGLLSLDLVDLEVLRRSGSPQEQVWARKIIPVVSNSHFLLVTLLLCNAMAMEALPIVLDKLVHEAIAIIISVTAVLMFGEVIPQAICSKYGLQIGAALALPVRVLMIITSPISYPISLLLDCALGGGHAVMMRRKQLKTLVGLHCKDEGFGGKLSKDEIQIISGALDLTNKKAYHAMTPLHKTIMVSKSQKLDDSTIEAIMSSKPFSRLPVYADNDRSKIIGLVLVKELLEYVKRFPDAPISSLKIRPIPSLSASTPMYDMLKLFRTGRSHMALLTQPELGFIDNAAVEKESASLLGNLPMSDGVANLQSEHALAHDIEQPLTATTPWTNQNGSTSKVENHVELVSNSGGPQGSQAHEGNGFMSSPAGLSALSQSGDSPAAVAATISANISVAASLNTALSTSAPLRADGGSSILKTISGHSSDDDDNDVDEMVPLPMNAKPGEPIGIITIEDVIEELMQFEIADETDQYIDNEQTKLVTDAQLEADLPENLKTVLTMAEAVKHASLNRSSMNSLLTYQQSVTGGGLPPPHAEQPTVGEKLGHLITSVLRPASITTRNSGEFAEVSGQQMMALSSQRHTEMHMQHVPEARNWRDKDLTASSTSNPGGGFSSPARSRQTANVPENMLPLSQNAHGDPGNLCFMSK